MKHRLPVVGFHIFFAILLTGLLCTPAMAADPIGSVNTVTGECHIIRGNDTLTAEVQQPVMLNDELSTGKNARLGIVFLDETTLTLDESSQASIDNYVYNDEASNLLFKFTKGTFRTVTGGIVKQNPEGFNMETPLATIGIRGSDVYAIIQPEGEETGALHLGENHALEVKTEQQTIRITESGLRVKISPEGVIFTPTRIPASMFNTMLNLGSATPSGSQSAPSGSTSSAPNKKMSETSAGSSSGIKNGTTTKSTNFNSPKGRTNTPTKTITPTKAPAQFKTLKPTTLITPTRTTSPTTTFKVPTTPTPKRTNPRMRTFP